MEGFIEINSIDEITDLLKSKNVLTNSVNKPLTIISGFSSTLKTTISNKLKESGNVYLVTSPVKLIHKLNYSFGATAIISSITFFYCQFFAIYNAIINNKDNNKYYIVERGVWDYLYFLKRFNCMNTLFDSIDELDFNRILIDVFKELNITEKIVILVLKNESEFLINKAITSNEETRKLAYKDKDEYLRYQDAYLEFIEPLISKVNADIIRIKITDKVIK